MKGTLIFYKLVLQRSNQLSLFNDHSATLKSKIEDFADNHKEEDLLYANDTNIIEIESIADDHIFGSFGKIEKLDGKLLTRGRIQPNMEITNLATLRELIESYTYFYLDLNKEECIILYNSNCTGFRTEFSKFLLHHFRVSGIYNDILIENKLREDIPESIGRAREFSTISYTYTSDKIPKNEFLSFKEISGIKNNLIKRASVKLYFETEGNFKDIAQNLSNTYKYSDSFSSFKLETENETIDVIEKMLSKKVSIPIDEDDLHNIDLVKDILKEQLLNY